MRAIVAAGLAAASIAAISAVPSFAQDFLPMDCGDAREVIAELENGYGESKIGAGPVDDRAVVVVYASRLGETWSVVAVYADGRACVIADGFGWTTIPQGDPA